MFGTKDTTTFQDVYIVVHIVLKKIKHMKKYNYYYDRIPITKEQFLLIVPKDWEDNVKDGEYSFGYYRAIEIEQPENN